MAVTWSAPGRVNLIGEHVDYNGGSVLPFAIDRRTEVSVAPRRDGRVVVRSDALGAAELAPTAGPGEVEGWERYVAGALWAFRDSTGQTLGGLDVEVTSTLPVGAGLSSSAALECAVLAAVDDLSGTRLGARGIAALALRAEREFVGVPCGPMDQLAVMLAQPDHALLLDSASLRTEQIPFALGGNGLQLLVIDTGVSHSLGDGAYADRRAACAAAAEALGLPSLSAATLQQVLGLADPALLRRARHVVTEIERVDRVVMLLRAGRIDDIGALLTASHRSLAEDFEVSCPELDTAVAAALGAGALGARMTGAGFGGSAIALCRAPDAAALVERVHREFLDAGFAAPQVWPVSPTAGTRRQAR